MAKDTDEISVDKTFVADQDPQKLYDAMRRVLSYANTHKEARGELVRPMAKPIIPVELKIIGIMKHFSDGVQSCDLGTLLDDAVSRPDLVAIFIGVPTNSKLFTAHAHDLPSASLPMIRKPRTPILPK